MKLSRSTEKFRLAIFSDIHGNSIALDAVCNDIKDRGGVDGYLVLGDMIAIGFDPIGVLERLLSLPDTLFIRGNTERYVSTGELPSPSVDDVMQDLSKAGILQDVSSCFAWTQGAVEATGWRSFVTQLPVEQRLTLPDGTRLLGVHATLKNDEQVISPIMSDTEIALSLAGCEADLVILGHVHWPMERMIDSMHVVCVGCVGNPLAPDLRASYVLLEADKKGYELEFHRVAYDIEAVIDAINKSSYPPKKFIIDHYKGSILPPWERVK
jgi:predicted phosphodiesterase